MNNILNALKGKKTYIAALLAIAIGIYLQNTELIMTGLIGAGLRSSITDLQK